jgi:hypothetical protein
MTARIYDFSTINRAADDRVLLAREMLLTVGLPPDKYRWACGVLLALSDDSTDHANARAVRASLDEDERRAAERALADADADDARRLNAVSWLLLTLIPAAVVWGYVGSLIGRWLGRLLF